MIGRYRGYSGLVYIYHYFNDTWSEETILKPSGNIAHGDFGCSVSLSGGYLVVGSKVNDKSGNNSGAAYLYQYVNGTWIELVKLISSDGFSNQYFGSEVVIEGNQIAIGDGDTILNSSNSVYIYNLQDILLDTIGDRHRNEIQLHINKTSSRPITILQCNDLNMTAYWLKSSVKGDNITVKMIGDNCKEKTLNENNTMYWISVMYLACGSIVKEDNDNIIVQNTVVINVFTASNTIITRGEKIYQFNMKCVFPRDLLVSVNDGYVFSNESTKVIYNKSASGYIKASMDIYESEFFMQKLNYPVRVTLDEPMYVGIKIVEHPNVKLVVRKCYATSSPAIHSEAYVFFLDQCPLDRTFRRIEIYITSILLCNQCVSVHSNQAGSLFTLCNSRL